MNLHLADPGRGDLARPHSLFAFPRLRRGLPVGLAFTLGLGLFARPAGATWPLIWDFDGRGDTPVAAALTPGGELFVAVEAYAQGAAQGRTVLLRIDASGAIAALGEDPALARPTALALADPPNRLLVIGHEVSGAFRATSFAADGTREWSRTRSDLAPPLLGEGPAARPIWDASSALWRAPVGKSGAMAILSWDPGGTPQADRVWAPPTGLAEATGVLPLSNGGLLVAGSGTLPVAGWWTVALDANGAELWRQFEDGETTAGSFSGAFPLDADAASVTLWADDETHCGVFSLRLWSLDLADGTSRWATTWPSPAGCSFFQPHSVRVSGERIVASGSSSVFGDGASFESVALSFSAATGGPLWARAFAGATVPIQAEISSDDGSALMATTLFPPQNPGPTPLWIAGWDRAGRSCGAATELLAARVAAALNDASGRWWIVGSAWTQAQGDNVVVQLVDDPCRTLLDDDFETGALVAWHRPAA